MPMLQEEAIVRIVRPNKRMKDQAIFRKDNISMNKGKDTQEGIIILDIITSPVNASLVITLVTKKSILFLIKLL